jgi:pimeloyl-ACP methyl ester carboxylesterase
VPKVKANGIEIEYLIEGDTTDRPLLLVMGLGAQLITWPQGFVDALCERGFFVICFDNRDSGLSTKLEGTPDITALFTGDTSSAPYLVEDMADDAAGLLAELGLPKVHVVGASLGGMIVQALAIHHQDRFHSVCSIMSTTGNRAVGAPTAEAITALLRPIASSREEAIEASLAGSRVIGSPGYPVDEAVLRARAAAAYDRSYSPEGTARQLAAVLASPDRTEGLHGVQLPFLVLHGEADPLVTLSGGQATAEAVPDAKLITYPGMGHDLPEQLWTDVAEAIVANAELAPAS